MEEDNIKPAAAEQVEERDSVEVEKVEASAEEELKVTEKTIEMLRTVFDPEIPVNVYDLGLTTGLTFSQSSFSPPSAQWK